jgi:hypothetical protein
MPDDRPEFPAEELRAAARGDREAHRHIDALHRELGSDHPTREAIDEHVGALRKRAPIGAIVANWFDDPRTQMFINEIVQAGL